MTAALVQKAEYNGSAATSTVTLTGVATGNTLYVTIEEFDASAFTSLSDDKINTHTLDLSERNQANSGNVRFYRANNVTGGTVILTVVRANALTHRWYVEEVSGVANAAPEVTMTRVTGGFNNAPTIAYTTVSANCYARTYSSTNTGVITTDGTHTAHSSSGNRPGMASYLVDTGAAGVKSGTVALSASANWAVSGLVYAAGAVGPTVTSVTQTSGGTEGSPAVMTVALSGATSGSTNFAATLAGVTATGSGTDFTSDLASATYSNGVTFSGGNIVVPDAVSGWTVTISTTGDTLDEANETATLTIGGTAGTLTITDDDAAPTITGTTSSTVTAGSPVVITYSPGLSGQTRTYTLALTDGTAVGGTDYDNTTVTGDFAVTAGTGSVSISGSTVTVDPGVTEFTLTITTTA